MFILLAGRVRPIHHRIEVEHNGEIPVWAIAMVIGIVVFVVVWYCFKLYMASRVHKDPV